MKISPMGNMPTIASPATPSVGLDKIARAKAVASGQKPEEQQEQQQATQQSSERRIKMNVSRTPESLTNEQLAAALASESEAGVGISDNSAQVNEGGEVTQPLSPQLAMIAKQRRALQLREQQLAEKEKALQSQGGQTRAELEAKLKSSPLSVLQELGVTYDQLTNEILQNQNGVNPEVAELKAQLAALKGELQTGIESKFAEKDTAQEQAVFAQIRRNVDKLAFSSDKFKLIRESKSQSDVEELIRRTWKENNEVLDEEEAMEAVEKELREDARRFAKLLEELEPTTPEPVAQAGRPMMKTLTNKDSAKPVMNRRQRAIAAALNQLPKG